MNVAILGLGTVGKGIYDLLQEHPNITIAYVLEIDPSKTNDINAKVVSSYDTILEDETVDIIIELIGGLDPAYRFIKQALEAKKHVVTANKAVISKYYQELHSLAQMNKVHLLFEASVGGAIVVLDPLKTIAKINRIHRIEGIVNGATNYILSRIFHDQATLEDAIHDAHDLGYLERGTTDDMDGLDAMRKINILSMLSYQAYFDQQQITVVPLSSITPEMIAFVKQCDHEMKYIVSSQLQQNNVTMSVIPVVYPKTGPFQSITYELNAITIKGTYHKAQTFIGQGAGRYPTASAVLYDVISIIEDNVPSTIVQNQYTVNQTSPTHRYVIQTDDGCTITEPVTLDTLLQDKSIRSIARWEGQL